MRVLLLVSALSFFIASGAGAEKKPAPEPRLSSVHPFTGQIGKTYRAVIRGRNLKGAHGLEITGEGIEGRVLRIDAETSAEPDKKSGVPTDLVQVEIASRAATSPGVRKLRLLTSNGVTNEIPITITAEPVTDEGDVRESIRTFPLVITGRISQRGEVDTFWFEAASGQTLTFQARSGHSSLDPSLAVFESAPSWFDPKHMEQIAFNDEPLSFPGLSTDAQVVRTFRKSGQYCVKVQSSSGQGSADAVYELRILTGDAPPPPLHPKLKDNAWEERQFTRELSRDYQGRLARRGGLIGDTQPVETYRAVRAGAPDAPPVMRLPGVVEGRIENPAEAHRIKLHIEKAENIAIEIETPDATMPRFNPVILLFEPGGAEVATNVYTKRNNNGLYMMKMIQSKVALPLQAPGDYEMEIRDITTDRAGADFRYRILVRPQIPHVGKLEVTEEQINLRRGQTRDLNVAIEREEGFNGLITLAVEGLPAGVSVLPAAPKPVDKPPLPNGGKLERYTPVVQNSALVFVASTDAVVMDIPSKIRIIARPMVDGRLGEPILVKELPLMVLSESAT